MLLYFFLSNSTLRGTMKIIKEHAKTCLNLDKPLSLSAGKYAKEVFQGQDQSSPLWTEG